MAESDYSLDSMNPKVRSGLKWAAFCLLTLAIYASTRRVESRVEARVLAECRQTRPAAECERLIDYRAKDCFEEHHREDAIDYGAYRRCVLVDPEAPPPDGGATGAP